MAQISIERLTLKLSGLSSGEGKRLAHLIAEGLSTASLGAEFPYQIDTLRVKVAASPEDRVDWLSQQVVAEIVGQLQRTVI